MWSKAKKVLTVLGAAALVLGVYVAYEHSKTDHESLHLMVQMFNNCLAKPECKALFTAAQAPVVGK